MTNENIGIYKITNNITGKVYIGQSERLDERFGEHVSKLEAGKHTNKSFQDDCINMDKDLLEHTLSFEILIKCAKEDLIGYERSYILDHITNLGENLVYNY
jgi:predicted GIY-YIG superfamily endonuclease